MINIALKLLFVLGLARACIIISVSKKTTPRMMKRSDSNEDCEELQRLEDLAFEFCEHKGDGFTWTEVETCEDIVKKISHILPFEMPTKDVFDWMDVNKNGDLTMKEWKKTASQALGCE